MGQSLSQEVQKKPHVLGDVERRMRNKLECTKANLYIDALNDECIAIVCAVAKFDGMLYIEDAKNQDPKGDIESIMGSYLHMEGNKPDDELIELVTNVVKALLTHKPGTVEGRHIHVVYANKGFIRFDYFIYLQILDDGNAALSYYGQVGLMDVTKAKPQVLIYELRRATDDKKLEKAGKELEKSESDSMKKVGKFLIKLATGP